MLPSGLNGSDWALLLCLGRSVVVVDAGGCFGPTLWRCCGLGGLESTFRCCDGACFLDDALAIACFCSLSDAVVLLVCGSWCSVAFVIVFCQFGGDLVSD